jgi:4,5-DOPA dioxygenase extradiol
MQRRNFIASSSCLVGMNTLSKLRAFSESLGKTDSKMPLLFIGHGSPMNGIEQNEFSKSWLKLGNDIQIPTAVICISAHWLTNGTFVTAMNHPKTIHDFGGFPQALFDVDYPAPGNITLANETKKLITKTNVGLDHDWGLDHGTWSVVKNMYPKANIPVIQLSIDYYQPPQYHYDLAKELAVLRKKGVLIIGSGNMVHNLRMIKMNGQNENFGFDWAIEMNEIFKKKILSKNHKALIDFPNLGKAAQLAIPSPDHYYPLLYILGMQEKNENAQIFNDKAVMGSITMTSLKIG